MFSRFLLRRRNALLNNIVEVKESITKVVATEVIEPKPEAKVNPQSKTIYAYIDNKLVGIYDSITLCATTLGLSRAMIKRAIENGTVLDNGFLLTFNKK